MSITIPFSDFSIPERRFDSHKGDFGRVFVIAGSIGMTGAACLSAQAALRSGCGLVTLGIPYSLNSICEIKLTEVITKPFKETPEITFSLKALDDILSTADDSDVVLIGPGISRNKETDELVYELIRNIKQPLVVDADALSAVALKMDVLKQGLASGIVVTPHPGEMGRLLGIATSEVQSDRRNKAVFLSQEYGVHTVLKGAGTIVASPEGAVYVNSTGNSGMATAGSGDVLCGLLAGFIAQGMSLFDSARCAVFIHGLSGDEAKGELGERSLVATDILLKIPLAIKSFFG